MSVSTNAEAEMSVKRILVSVKVLEDLQWIWKKYINKTVGAFHGIPKVKRNP